MNDTLPIYHQPSALAGYNDALALAESYAEGYGPEGEAGSALASLVNVLRICRPGPVVAHPANLT